MQNCLLDKSVFAQFRHPCKSVFLQFSPLVQIFSYPQQTLKLTGHCSLETSVVVESDLVLPVVPPIVFELAVESRSSDQRSVEYQRIWTLIVDLRPTTFFRWKRARAKKKNFVIKKYKTKTF